MTAVFYCHLWRQFCHFYFSFPWSEKPSETAVQADSGHIPRPIMIRPTLETPQVVLFCRQQKSLMRINFCDILRQKRLQSVGLPVIFCLSLKIHSLPMHNSFVRQKTFQTKLTSLGMQKCSGEFCLPKPFGHVQIHPRLVPQKKLHVCAFLQDFLCRQNKCGLALHLPKVRATITAIWIETA